MTFKQLETFYWICQLSSFVAAAAHLHATQSTVSMRIQDLENSLGIKLFDRSARTTIPTAKGRELYRYVEQLLTLTSTIRQRVADPHVQSGTVRLGVTEFVAVTWLSDLVGAIGRQYPEVAVELDVDLTVDQLRKLEHGIIDIALVPGPVKKPGLVEVPLGSVEFAWMASPKLGIPDKMLTAKDFDNWPLLLLTRESNLHSFLGSWLDPIQTGIQRANVCNSINVLAELATAGLGIAYLPVKHYHAHITRGDLQVLKTTPALPLLKYFAVYYRKNINTLNETIAALAERHSRFTPPTMPADGQRQPVREGG